MGGSITVLGDMLIAHYSGQVGEISDIRAQRESVCVQARQQSFYYSFSGPLIVMQSVKWLIHSHYNYNNSCKTDKGEVGLSLQRGCDSVSYNMA